MALNSTRDVMIYLTGEYPYPNELSKARLTKLMYLADWRMAIVEGRQITPIDWVFNHYGPYVDDVADVARRSADFAVEDTQNAFGARKQLIRLVNPTARPDLDEQAIEALEHVIDRTSPLSFADFLNLVYSTYPILVSQKYSQLDLPKLADAYQDDLLAEGGI